MPKKNYAYTYIYSVAIVCMVNHTALRLSSGTVSNESLSPLDDKLVSILDQTTPANMKEDKCGASKAKAGIVIEKLRNFMPSIFD